MLYIVGELFFSDTSHGGVGDMAFIQQKVICRPCPASDTEIIANMTKQNVVEGTIWRTTREKNVMT